MDAIVAGSIASERFRAALLLLAAAVSLFLGAIGVYGVVAETIRRREHEIAIRVSLGAQPSQLVAMLLRESGVFVLVGTVLGLAIASIATRALRSLLFEVSATDPVTIAIVTALIIAVALVATLVPARRVVRFDPIAALRSE